VGEKANTYRILMGKTEGKRLFEDFGEERKMILKRIFKKWDGGHGLN